jgi:hypothetical protein
MDIEVCGSETITPLLAKFAFDIIPDCLGCSATTDKLKSELDALFSVNSANCPITSYTINTPSNLAIITSSNFLGVYNGYTPGQYSQYTLTAKTLGNV